MKSYTPIATERPRDDSVFQVVITETVLPFGNGKATLVWVDADDPDTLVTHPAIDESNPDRQIEVYDANDCNCLLPGELVWIRFDEEIGAYVPEGSQGLVRKAVAQADVAADAVGTFSIAKDGEVITFPDDADPPVDQSVDIDVKSVNGATDQTLYFVVYLRGDQSPGGDVNREGRWETITADAPPQLTFAQAPSGGVPARSGATPGSATCELLELNGSGDFEETGVTLTVLNWVFDIAASSGDRILQISSATEPSFVVGWSCTNAAADDIFETAPPP